MSYIYLFGAIALEVLGTMLLPLSNNFTKVLPTLILILSYLTSFYLLSITVQKLPLSVVYASWAGLGVFSVSILSYVIYKQTLTLPVIIGLFLIVIGVTLVNIYK
ncbi:MAG: multidrug efflux SMR transporter [SAR86 cluster bacterium]|uniref:Multidrug efflux SMR transporter n=1 Tax=SAR86 cluster bacterium TaxID=2030880 RepID=A0A520MZE1_9GAMM|nr:MAG: multidrug efflux SMR transporter [SAR86 cluster bacterium]|tara:strand:+ start:213 stop:527 length:315 start_codon:yes stop_codon:yes gene_type:complete